jgi:hypothetical protein
LAIAIPIYKPVTLKKKFRKILDRAKKVLPFLNNSTVSKVKEEYVLKPPQNPVIIKSLIAALRLNLSTLKISIAPKTTQLKKFAVNVAKGKTGFHRPNNLETKKRATLPNPPPKKTSKNSFMFYGFDP